MQSTGLGGPSAAAVVAELVALGARRMVRVGTAAGLGATASARSSWPTRRWPATGPAARWAPASACRPIRRSRTRSRAAGTAARGLVASADVHDPAEAERWARAGALAIDLSTAAVLAAAARHGAAAAAVVAVTRAGGERIGDDELEAAEAALGRAALAALRLP